MGAEGDSPMNFSQQLGLYPPKMNAPPVVVIGAGAVGSHVVYALVKMGVSEIEVWDHDHVSSHNVPMSLYGPEDVGMYKVEALQRRILDLTGVTIRIRKDAYADESFHSVYVISCVDLMSVRKKIWEHVRMNMSIGLFCDTRVGEAYIEVYSIIPWKREDINRYEATLFDDKDAMRTYCGRHGIIFTSLNAARIISSSLAAASMLKPIPWRVAERCDTLERVF